MIKEQNYSSFSPLLGEKGLLDQNLIQQIQQQVLTQYVQQLQQKERNLTQESSKLKEENTKMQEKLINYENKQEELLNEIQDMKALLKRVYLEGEIQANIMRKKNIELKNENEVLKKALSNLQNNIDSYSNFNQMNEFYESFNEEASNGSCQNE